MGVAQNSVVSLPELKMNFETKMKFARFDKENLYKIENSFKSYGENDSSWYDGNLKFSIANPSTSLKHTTVSLEKLLIGNRFYENGSTIVDVQIGKCKMDDIFDSKLQFNSNLNGIVMNCKYKCLDLNISEFVIDSLRSHYGSIGQISYSFSNKLPAKITYSLTDWHHDSEYVISQLGMIYTLNNFCYPVDIYGALLKNHQHTSHANGCYAGIKIGNIKQAFDWIVDFNYQYAGVNAIADFDYNGIGVGSGVNLKATLALTDFFSVETKFAFGDTERIEVSGIYKW